MLTRSQRRYKDAILTITVPPSTWRPGTISEEIRTGTRYIEVAGPEQYSPNDIARALSSTLGRTIEAVTVPRDKWTEFSVGQGMPEGRTEPRAEMVNAFNSGWIHFGVPGTEHVTGTTSLTSVIAKLAANGAPGSMSVRRPDILYRVSSLSLP